MSCTAFLTKNLPENIISEYNPIYTDSYRLESSLSDMKNSLIVELINANKSSSTLTTERFSMKIKMYIKMLENKWVLQLKESLKEEELCFYGHEYDTPDTDADYSNVIIKSLLYYTFCTKDADPIDDEEYFFSKTNNIETEIDSLEECVQHYMDHNFVDKYREYKDTE